MQPGVVVRVRINPSTCISVLDTLKAVGIKVEEKTFSTCVSAALNILVETAKSSGVLPAVDPYTFNERMRDHTGEAAPDRRKLPKGNVGHINPLIFQEKSPDLGHPKWAREDKKAKPTVVVPAQTAEVKVDARGVPLEYSTEPEVVIARKEAGKKLTDLMRRRADADNGVGGIHWSDADQEEYDRVFAVAYPNG